MSAELIYTDEQPPCKSSQITRAWEEADSNWLTLKSQIHRPRHPIVFTAPRVPPTHPEYNLYTAAISTIIMTFWEFNDRRLEVLYGELARFFGRHVVVDPILSSNLGLMAAVELSNAAKGVRTACARKLAMYCLVYGSEIHMMPVLNKKGDTLDANSLDRALIPFETEGMDLEMLRKEVDDVKLHAWKPADVFILSWMRSQTKEEIPASERKVMNRILSDSSLREEFALTVSDTCLKELHYARGAFGAVFSGPLPGESGSPAPGDSLAFQRLMAIVDDLRAKRPERLSPRAEE